MECACPRTEPDMHGLGKTNICSVVSNFSASFLLRTIRRFIHLSSVSFCVRVAVEMDIFPGTLGSRQENILNGTPVNLWILCKCISNFSCF